MADQVNDGYDVVVVGWGAVGLSGAPMLARALRSVVVAAGVPRNAPAAGVHGLLAREGIRPAVPPSWLRDCLVYLPLMLL
jgi:thioredoxin reductase